MLNNPFFNPKLQEWILSRIKQARQKGMSTEEVNYVVGKLKKVEIPEK